MLNSVRKFYNANRHSSWLIKPRDFKSDNILLSIPWSLFSSYLSFFSRLIFVLQIFINFFLTSFSLLGQYWENLALDRSCTDRAELGSYKNDPGPLFFSAARASEVKRCLWLTEDWPNYMALEDWLEVWPKTDRRLTEDWPNYMALRLNLPIMNLPLAIAKLRGF